MQKFNIGLIVLFVIFINNSSYTMSINNETYRNINKLLLNSFLNLNKFNSYEITKNNKFSTNKFGNLTYYETLSNLKIWKDTEDTICGCSLIIEVPDIYKFIYKKGNIIKVDHRAKVVSNFTANKQLLLSEISRFNYDPYFISYNNLYSFYFNQLMYIDLKIFNDTLGSTNKIITGVFGSEEMNYKDSLILYLDTLNYQLSKYNIFNSQNGESSISENQFSNFKPNIIMDFGEFDEIAYDYDFSNSVALTQIDINKEDSILISNNPSIISKDFKDKYGNIKNISQLKSEFILIFYWASWCAPCKLAFKYLDTLYKDMSKDKLEILAINCRESSRVYTENVLQYFKPKFDIYYEGDDFAKANSVIAYPTFILTNKDNTILYRNTGFSFETIDEIKSIIIQTSEP